MAHEVETMAWANEVPWHGLGNRVDSSVSIDEMLIAAGLNWEVEQHPCFTKIGDEVVAIDRKALVRSTDKRVLTVTGKDWKPFQNRDALEFFRDYTRIGGAKLETAGSLRGGKVVWGLASVQKGFTIGGDKVNGYILLISPHEVGKAITVRTTAVRVVCANTMAMAERNAANYTQSHIKMFDVSAAKATVALAQDDIARTELEAQALMSLKMSEYDTVRVLAKYFQPAADDVSKTEERARVRALINDPKEQNKALQQVLLATAKAPGATPGNAWGVLNGVTYWTDHMAGRERDARMFRSWLGHTGKMVETIKSDLLEMAMD